MSNNRSAAMIENKEGAKRHRRKDKRSRSHFEKGDGEMIEQNRGHIRRKMMIEV